MGTFRNLDIATIPFDIIGVVSGGYSAYKSVQNLRWVRAGGALKMSHSQAQVLA
ncbi:hypothetical protein OH492_12000 [Vibrio chagasii]|nr:hypothetical protein [Vibrio chagasii]